MSKMLVAAVLLSSLAGHAAAEERARATPKEAELMVHKAVEYLKKEGRAKALATFSDPKGPFTYRDLYVFVLDIDGNVVAHGRNPAMIGRNDIKQPQGKYGFAAKIIELAKGPGKGWLEYKFENPESHKDEAKVTYVERVGDLVISCGVFKPEKG